MSECFKRAYSYCEFAGEYGEVVDLNDNPSHLITSKGSNLHISSNVVDAIDNKAMVLDRNSLKHCWCILMTDPYSGMHRWYLYRKPYFTPPTPSYYTNSIYITGCENYTLIRRRNYNPIHIEFVDNQDSGFEICNYYLLDKVEIYTIEKNKGCFLITTSKEVIRINHTTSRVFFSLIKVLEFESPKGYKFIIERNGDFSRRVNK